MLRHMIPGNHQSCTQEDGNFDEFHNLLVCVPIEYRAIERGVQQIEKNREDVGLRCQILVKI